MNCVIINISSQGTHLFINSKMLREVREGEGEGEGDGEDGKGVYKNLI